ncbi:hypothetical protein C5167_025247 [Papaver somniferum]|uniref:Ribosomal protein L7Ae/L30e/S12e/Gadd45 domain-containing protein n=4 Tax=Magnoliopsida TaxID=3398 RepID=A0A4Y7JU98_PAPSO|nr:hypothetical protein C5167_025247 [Papaver somniferum]
MVAVKKMKKTHESINNRLALVMKSGKYTLGYKTVLRTLRSSKSKLIIISNNCPPLRKSEIEYYAMLAKVGVHHFNGNNVDLGTACGRYYRVSCLSIIDPGDSDIIKTLPGDQGFGTDQKKENCAENFRQQFKAAAVLVRLQNSVFGKTMEELRSSPPPIKRLKVFHDIESSASVNDRIPFLPENLFKMHRVKNKKQIQNPKFENFVSKVMRLLQDGAYDVDRFRLRVRFSGEGAVQKLVAGCPILETLVMVGCHIYDEKLVDISVPSLRNFTMRHIYLPSDSRIKISNPNLSVFNYTVMECNMKNDSIDKFSSLMDAYIEVLLRPGGSYSIKRYNECFDNVGELFSGLASIRSLTLPRSTLQILSNALDLLDSLPSFDNLNKLMLTSLRQRDYFQVIAYLLQSAPSLESLVIDLVDQPRIGVIVKEEGQAVSTEFLCLKGLVLHHLKEVKISSFGGTEAEIEFLKQILTKANALQKLSVK